MNNNKVQYGTLINDIYSFRRFGSMKSNPFDMPGLFFFKLFFYFDETNGLLSLANSFSDKSTQDNPSATLEGDKLGISAHRSEDSAKSYTFANSAFNYLLLNNELERADQLQSFIHLLSNINTNSPWYWQSISGLDGVLDRKYTGTEFKIDEEKPSITIKCLPDAYDTRIGTLLDLYRSACFSHVLKKEVVPANLRKFNMGIYIYHTPVHNFLKPLYASSLGSVGRALDIDTKIENISDAILVNDRTKSSSQYIASSKYIELMNCEIDINSPKNGYSDLNNTDGFAPEYEIVIKVGDAYEYRTNEFLGTYIGDIVRTDFERLTDDFDELHIEQDISNRYNRYDLGFLGNAAKDVIGGAVHAAKGAITSLALGNIYGFSLTNTAGVVQTALTGNISSVAGQIRGYHNYTPNHKDLTNQKLPGYTQQRASQNAASRLRNGI